jgi:di/tricarboxylate transporter
MEALLAGVSWKAVVTLAILAAAIYGFVSEKVGPDVTAFLALLGLLLTGILTPVEAFSGFSHPATVSVAAVLVLSAGVERSGALEFLARRVLAPLGHSELLFTIVVMSVIAAISAFVNNTAAVAIFIPVVLQACGRVGLSPGRILMPMSHAATFGGLCTLIGTSTNLVAHEYALSQKMSGFSMFELAKVGLPMLVGGFAYILVVGRWFLPRDEAGKSDSLIPTGQYLAELIIRTGSSLVGLEVKRDLFERDFDLELVGLLRAGQAISLNTHSVRFADGDSLLVVGALERILSLAAREDLDVHRPIDKAHIESELRSTEGNLESSTEQTVATPTEHQHLPLAEVVVLSTSGLIGRTLKEARFSERYDAVVIGLRRRGGAAGRPSTTPLHAGDVILVEGERDAIKALSETPGFLVIGTPPRPAKAGGRTLIVFLTIVGVVIAVSFGVLPIVTAATAGCAVLMLTGRLTPRQAYRAIDLSIVFLLAGSLALGAALEKTGVTHSLASALSKLGGTASPFVVLACFFLVAVVVSEFMSNSGTVPLLAPLALSVAAAMSVNPKALLVAVTFGSSAAFAMPIGYQTSLMIYGPGGYRFKDFIRMGLPLDFLLAVLALWLIPIYWPL